MPYQVVEKITNVTEVIYENLDDFLNLCYRNGFDRHAIVQFGANTLVNDGLGSQEDKDLFVQHSQKVQASYSEWDSNTQSVVKTRVFEDEAAYLFMKDVAENVYSRPTQRFTTTLISAEVI